MNQELLQPSLKPNVDYQTRSYNLTHYIVAAIFGGFLPAIVLGMKNANGLRIRPLWNYLLAGVGIVLFIVTAAWSYRHLLAVGIGAAYYFLMKKRYRHHMALQAKTRPILGEAILYIILGKVVEAFVLVKGVQLFYGN
ncbi:hypothetical protein J31TS6_14890 [Brevibacillus reuszeri]|uniref:hypothetical protein n=1 Tax=Brevibacillus reuszeri TaxID=54915 RepID=UPI001B1ECA49|nr:hypothetical protein [Brevibacillus reuszeri]GIO05461.1 hypothetical protein J31TS6_14890 [Brevibacillus reuszeri]